MDHGQGRHHRRTVAAEITAKAKKDPGEIYRELTEFGVPLYDRTEALATTVQKVALEQINRESIDVSDLADEKMPTTLINALCDGNFIGGIKVVAKHGWFAARRTGTEYIYKIYAESFNSKEHRQQIETEAQTIVGKAFTTRRCRR